MLQKPCEKNEKLYFSNIKKLKEGDKECIIQPRPSIPEGQYRRRRCYTKQHKASWISCLEKMQYVKCIFQNCHFIAMSLEDMISHFGYCNGDSSFATHKCPVCHGYVTSKEILNRHIEVSHKSVKNVKDKKTELALDLTVNVFQKNNFRCAEEDLKLQKSDDKKIQSQGGKQEAVENVDERAKLNFSNDVLPTVTRKRRYNRKLKNKDEFDNCIKSTLRGKNSLQQKFCSKEEISDNVKSNLFEKGISRPSEAASFDGQNKRKRKKNVDRDFPEKHLESESPIYSQPPSPKISKESSESAEKVTNYKKRGRKPRLKSESPIYSQPPSPKMSKESSESAEKMTNCKKRGRKPRVKSESPIYSQPPSPKMCKESSESVEKLTNCKKRGRKPRVKSESPVYLQPPSPKMSKESSESVEKVTNCKKRGRKPRGKLNSLDASCVEKSKLKPEATENEIQCGKCKNFKGTRKSFNDHNVKKHTGLGWIEGDAPVDLKDEKEVLKLVKAAFKVTKKGTCEMCQDVKKSCMGFISHIQICGKSEEEKDSLKVQCPHCPAKCLKYSMPVHIKMSHVQVKTDEDGINEKTNECASDSNAPLGKRRSALKAVSKFQEVLKEQEDSESPANCYILYEKTSGRIPRLSTKLTNIWYKLQKEKRKIHCRHDGCTFAFDSVKEAKLHHYTCPLLPDKVFMCEGCDFYSTVESDLPSHISANHNRLLKRKKQLNEDEEGENGSRTEESENFDGSSSEEGENDSQGDANYSTDESDFRSRKKKKTTDAKRRKIGRKCGDDERERKQKKSTGEVDEMLRRKKFCKRENLESVRGAPYFYTTLNMTLEEESKKFQVGDAWPDFHTRVSDWQIVSPDAASDFLPTVTRSISISAASSGVERGNSTWKRLKRFQGELIEGVPTLFAGGSVRCLSWCKISHRRSVEKKVEQYLALATTRRIGCRRNIFDRSEPNRFSLLQIWNCGSLENKEATDSPKFSLGIRHRGEIWDVSWFPEDTWEEGSRHRLRRLGILATAADDGILRVWSVCDSEFLPAAADGWRIYETPPKVKLIADENVTDSCHRLSIGQSGIVAGGFANGILAFWNLKTVSSPLNHEEKGCKVIRPFLVVQAHKTSIISLTFCPTDDRYITTAGLDRAIKLWDLESPTYPMEQFNKELSLNCLWLKNWPILIYNFDEVMPTSFKGLAKFVRDFFYEKHHSCLSLDETCLCMSFSDWFNIICGGNDRGQIKIGWLQNFISDQKKNKNNPGVSFVSLQKIKSESIENSKENCEEDVKKGKKDGGETSELFQSYEKIDSEFGLVFSSLPLEEKAKFEETVCRFEQFPIKAVNKVSFNPNFKSFCHVAAGYNSGFVRILCLKELRASNCLNNFLEKHSNSKS